MNKVIDVGKLTKSYGTHSAVDSASFTIQANKIYGLLGRNGAGKTTLMKMITAQIFPTSGDLHVFGEAPFENPNVLNQICFIKESQQYPDYYKVQDILAISKLIFPNWNDELATQLINEFNLPLKRKIKKLSRGMLSAVGIVIGLASRAPLTIFDEPYLGLDAVSRELFYNRLMGDYADFPRTVILSTHLIDEVSNLLEHVIVIDSGKIIIDEDAEKLRGRAITVTGKAAKVEAFLVGKKTIQRELFGGLLSATTIHSQDELVAKQAAANGLEVSPVSLQQLIVHLTNGKSNREGVLAK